MSKIDLSQIRNFFKSDRAILIGSICIALIFWLLVKLSKAFESQKDFDIFYNVPDSKILVDTPPPSVRATLSGVGWDLLSYYLRRRESSIAINLGDVSNFNISSTLLINKINEKLGSSSLRVSNINQEYISLKLEEKIEKKIPVILSHSLQFAAQYDLKDTISMRPDSISIAGPYSKIAPVNEWYTQNLKLENLKTNTSLSLPLEPSKDQQLSLSQAEVQLVIEVEQFTQKTLFLPIAIKNGPDSLNIFPSKVKLNCIVGLSQYGALDQDDFEAEVDLKNISPSSQNNTVTIELTKAPGYVKNITYSPKAVEYFIIQE